MSAADEGRTEKGTAKKRQKQRDEGQVLRSMEVNNLVQYIVAFAVISAWGGVVAYGLGDIMRHVLANATNIDVVGDSNLINQFYFARYLILLLPIFLPLLVAALAANIAQVGWHITWTPVKPKLSKLNVFANLKRTLASVNSLMELAKSVAKILVLTLMIYYAATPHLVDFHGMTELTPMMVVSRVWDVVYSIWMMMILFMIILAAIDYAYQRYRYEEDLKMTQFDVKDEQKQALGDVKVKQRMRQLGYQRLMQLMAQNAANADVVITNPTHFAVALEYKHGQMNAPRVVAKGIDHVALRMRKAARKKQIPIVENRGLARGLYYSTEIGEDIPDQFFRPVAEILAFIYKLNKQRATA
ncbi:flagellar biosynthesis protein FlhB [Sulfidibacter corallicola]|uniref:Flagellar biosynthetic protein FlhB n=1 Tax=Sulfidibacter corallicola TaxID=2818388 RepID=A0A8A4TR27_SULCO|nr:flagellar biosynthesis protein FlhB [Sulfidibacter corallicola]QTD52429.1 flagellar biosynthesis protein FlhB [Sulfidibacter corallicola]